MNKILNLNVLLTLKSCEHQTKNFYLCVYLVKMSSIAHTWCASDLLFIKTSIEKSLP